MPDIKTLSEHAAVVGTVDPDVLTATTHDTDWIDMSLFDRVLFVIQMGTLGTNATVDAQVRESADSAGGTPQNISGATITQLTEAGSDSDKQALIEVRSDELDVADSFRYISLRLTVGTASCDGAVVALGYRLRETPASAHDLSSVDEIVTN